LKVHSDFPNALYFNVLGWCPFALTWFQCCWIFMRITQWRNCVAAWLSRGFTFYWHNFVGELHNSSDYWTR
jgi:hypothetical protein